MADVERLAQELLADPVTEQFAIYDLRFTIEERSPLTTNHSQFTIETTLLPGVTDPPAENLRRAAELSRRLAGLERVATGQQYAIWQAS